MRTWLKKGTLEILTNLAPIYRVKDFRVVIAINTVQSIGGASKRTVRWKEALTVSEN